MVDVTLSLQVTDTSYNLLYVTIVQKAVPIQVQKQEWVSV